MLRMFAATCLAVVYANAAGAVCTPPSGTYGGVIPGISFNSAGETNGAYLQMVKVNVKYSKGSANPFSGSSFYAFIATLSTPGITPVGSLPVTASTWDRDNCIGSMTINGSTTPFYFVSTESGSTMMGFSPSSGSTFQWAWGRLEKL